MLTKTFDSYFAKQCKWLRLLTTMFISIQLFASIMNKKNRQCGYYKHIVKEDKEKQFCYLLRSCAKRMIDNINCPLGQNNFLEVRFFVPNLESCAEYCRDTQGRVRPRFFEQVGHETMCAFSRNNYFFSKLGHCQTYQNPEQPPQTFL